MDLIRVYISSTYMDLVPYRDAVVRNLRKTGQIIVSMEDYTASDERPLDKCLADVRRCDIYIGIFAHRYGFVPRDGNPESLSITELEYGEARKHNKPCLIFLLDENQDWAPKKFDSQTGEGDAGKRIKALRERLALDHTKMDFRSPDDLAAAAGSAVWNQLKKMRPDDKGVERGHNVHPAEPLPREITSDLFFAYSDIDAQFASDLNDYLQSHRLRLICDQRALLATSPDDFDRLERSVRSCHAAAVLISDASLRQLQERRRYATAVFRMIEARTRQLFAVCTSDESAIKMKQWPISYIEQVRGWRPREAPAPKSLHERLEGLRLNTGLDSGKHWVGLPVIVVAMTADEARSLDANPDLVRQKLGFEAYERFSELREAVSRGHKPISARYGEQRQDCCPFEGVNVSIAQFIDAIAERINAEQPFQLRGRLIKLQNYPFDELIHSNDLLGPVFTQLLSTGCVVIIDEYSLFHPAIGETLLSSGLVSNEQVSLVTLSPGDPYSTAPFNLIEAELRRRMTAAFNRFESAFDPQCELSVGDENRLKRWLNSSLPYTIQSLRNPKPNRHNISQFAKEQGLDPQPRIGSLLYTKGGLL
ncbi:MAG: DUF4062 domain-containing protein [Nitrospira sp.]|nr:DUF4062 domain-containing protein [Nitrospira sp.]MDH4244923.1 DUF4062 domain-containing protein [Nitrospira sp.]MDH4354817.1 DUF4062 domain-containing protein [Nitrospira sp.]MDH5317109.1 DUF4062 domain-containing protein [Nitrospira sp.]